MAQKSRSLQISSLGVTVVAHLLVIAITTLVLVWLLKFQHGLAFSSSNPYKNFNMHPFLMIVGFILIGGEGIMVYKTVSGARREVQKTIHVILNLTTLIAGIVGIYVVFKYHSDHHIPNLYSLHSWFGISTICLFALQWLLGFFSFVFPRSNTWSRASYLPWHVFLGAAIFFLAICAAETGLMENYLFFNLQFAPHSHHAFIINFTGLLIFLFAVCVGLTILLPPP